MKTIAVLGAAGKVGQLMLKELGRMPQQAKIEAYGRDQKPQHCDIAILCTDDPVSEVLAQELKDKADFIIDMSAKFRNNPQVPLVIPEINADTITKDTKLIASPNCTTTGLVMALNPLKKKYTLEEVFFCSYQAISGGGKKLIDEFNTENSLYQGNCIPLIGSIQDNGFTSEELKGLNETRKILRLPKIKVRPHTVRVPVLVSHSLGVTLKAKEDFDMDNLQELFASQAGVICDGNIYTPKEVAGRDEVFISRIRRDTEDANIIHFWITFDNLLKGAALNGRQIAQYLLENF